MRKHSLRILKLSFTTALNRWPFLLYLTVSNNNSLHFLSSPTHCQIILLGPGPEPHPIKTILCYQAYIQKAHYSFYFLLFFSKAMHFFPHMYMLVKNFHFALGFTAMPFLQGPREQQWPHACSDLVLNWVFQFNFPQVCQGKVFLTLEKGSEGIVFQMFTSPPSSRKTFQIGLEMSKSKYQSWFSADWLWLRR